MRKHALTLTVACLLGTLNVVPALAEGEFPATRPPRDLADPVALPSQPGSRPFDLKDRPHGEDAPRVASIAGLSDPTSAEYLHTVSTLLESVTGAPVPNLSQPASEITGSHSETGIISRGILFDADLDSDGLVDLVTYEAHYDDYWDDSPDIQLVALRGVDGIELWRKHIKLSYATYVLQMPDLDGDTLSDVVTLSLEIGNYKNNLLSNCPWCYGRDQTSVWELDVLSGASGSVSWHRKMESKFSYNVVPSYRKATLTDIAVVPLAASDQNQDGTNDLVLNVVDLEYSQVSLESAFSARFETERAVTHGLILDGKTGGEIASVDYESEEQVSFLKPTDDLVADTQTDFVWLPLVGLEPRERNLCLPSPAGCTNLETYSRQPGLELVMLDGSSLTEVWESSVSETPIFAPVRYLSEDLNGDGVNDLLFIDFWVDSEYWYSMGVKALELIDGRSGSTPWEVEFEQQAWAWVWTGVGAVGGDAGSDLMANGYFCDPNCEGRNLRIDGATGTSLLSSSFSGWSPYLTGDVDGDGVRDLLYEDWGEDADHFTLESGRDGSTIKVLSVPYSQDTFGGVGGIGDLDGDGTYDLIRYVVRERRQSRELTLEGVSMPHGSLLWATQQDIGLDEYLSLLGVADASGGGVTDIGVERAYVKEDFDTFEVDYRTRLELAAGTNGASQWSIGDEFPPVPARAFGKITGRLLDQQGNPLEGICARPLPVAGWQTYADVSDADGYFNIEELPAEAFKVRFSDCKHQKYKSQWYQGVDLETAAVVELGDNETVSLSDVTLQVLPPPVNGTWEQALVVDGLPFHDARALHTATEDPNYAEDCWTEPRGIWYRYEPTQKNDIHATVETGWNKSLTVFELVDGVPVEIECGWETWETGSLETKFQVIPGHVYLIRVGADEWNSTPAEISITESSDSRISGQITDDAGEPVEGCVKIAEFFAPFGLWFWVDFVKAEEDGSYRSAILDDGTHRAFFDDCDRGEYVAEWFDNKALFGEATDIEILRQTPVVMDVVLDDSPPNASSGNIADGIEVTLPARERVSTRYVTSASEPAEWLQCTFNQATVWYKFRAPATGHARVDTHGSNFDTALGAYVGYPSPATMLGCNDDAHLQWATLEFPVIQGMEYMIQAGGYQGAKGALTLTVEMM